MPTRFAPQAIARPPVNRSGPLYRVPVSIRDRRLRAPRLVPAPVAPIEPAKTADIVRTPVADLLVPVVPLWCSAARVSTTAHPTIAAGQSGWYGLMVHRATQDLLLMGWDMDLMPPDTDGSGDGTTAGDEWGNDRGEGAAIVIGLDLPVVEGRWNSATCPIPRVEPPASLGERLGQTDGQVIHYEHFPPGTLDAATVVKKYTGLMLGAGAVHIPRGRKLCVAWVVARAAVNGATVNHFDCSIDVRLKVGQTMPTRRIGA